jgi:hypothetical protein
MLLPRQPGEALHDFGRRKFAPILWKQILKSIPFCFAVQRRFYWRGYRIIPSIPALRTARCSIDAGRFHSLAILLAEVRCGEIASLQACAWHFCFGSDSSYCNIAFAQHCLLQTLRDASPKTLNLHSKSDVYLTWRNATLSFYHS